MNDITQKIGKNLLWLSDLHLDRANESAKEEFFDMLSATRYDGVVITGDISTRDQICSHLRALAKACAPRPVWFVLGNHDFFGGAFAEVDALADAVCHEHSNLHHLGHGEIVPIGDRTALIGTRGWADGRAGCGRRSWVTNPDQEAIKDFADLDRNAYFNKLQELGKESAGYLRQVLPRALGRFQHVLVATHVPPHTCAVKYDDRQCDRGRLPHFSNFSAGGAILGIARNFPTRRITVLAGHTHSAGEFQIEPGFEIRVGGAQPGKLVIQQVIKAD